jgi:HEAT repeat protein
VDDDGEAEIDERLAAISVLSTFVTRSPGYAPETVAALKPALEDPVVETTTLRALARIATESPGEIRTIRDPIVDRVTGNPLPTRQNAVKILQRLASHDPAAVTDVVDRLIDAVVSTEGMNVADSDLPGHEQSRLEDQSVAEEKLRQETAAVVSEIATAEPSAVAPELERLLAVVDPSTTRNPHLKDRLLDITRTVAQRKPPAILDHVDVLYEVVESEHSHVSLRANAAGALATLAETDFETVTDPAQSAIPALGDLLTADDPDVRANAGTFLSYVAQRYPGETASLTETLVDRLDDDEVSVRASTVWTLGYVDTEPAREALRKTADEDTSQDVRALASELLSNEPSA